MTISEERAAIIAAIEEARDEYEQTKAGLVRKLADLVRRCPHEKTSVEWDASGNESWVACDDCGKEI